MMQPQAESARLKIEFAQRSDPGRDPNKQINEDSCGYNETRFGHLGVLCDGMGGHYGGREASQLAIKTIFEVFEQAPAHLSPAAALKASIEEAGRRVYQLGGPPENRTRPGSTCVAILVHDRGIDVAHVGDSRAYVIRAGQIYPLTRDHSMVQGMIDAGMLTEEQAIGHPDSNKITRALGMRPEVEVEVRPETMEVFPGDIFILSSDGLTDLARPNDILGGTNQALASGSLDSACAALVQMANDRGGHDNITVQMARVLAVAPKVSMTIPQAPSAMMGGAEGARGAAMAPQGQGTPLHKLEQTIQMTRTDTTPDPGSAQASSIPSAQASPVPSAQPAGSPWGQVAPTAVGTPPPPTYDGGGGARPGGVAPTPPGASPTITSTPPSASPTVTEAGPVSEAWNSQRFSDPPPPGLAPYRIDVGHGSLPLPPPRPGSAGYAPTSQPGSGAQMTIADPSSMRYGVSGVPSSGQLSSRPGVRPAKGGIVFVIIGLSAVIAVLLVIILWAVLNR